MGRGHPGARVGRGSAGSDAAQRRRPRLRQGHGAGGAGAQRHLPRPLPAALRRQGGLLRAGLRDGGGPTLRGSARGGPRGRELAGGLPRRPRPAAAHRRRAAAAGEGAADRGPRGPRPGLGQAPAAGRALRSRRRLAPATSPAPAPTATALTAQFVVGAIEEAIATEIGAGRTATVERLLPDLAHLAVLNYFGEDEAWLELRSPELSSGRADRVITQ